MTNKRIHSWHLYIIFAEAIGSLYVPPQSQSGKIDRLGLAANGEVSGTVTFTKAFATTPKIQMTCYKALKGDESTLSTSYFIITITAKNNAAFSYKIKSSFGGSSAAYFQWNATA